MSRTKGLPDISGIFQEYLDWYIDNLHCFWKEDGKTPIELEVHMHKRRKIEDFPPFVHGIISYMKLLQSRVDREFTPTLTFRQSFTGRFTKWFWGTPQYSFETLQRRGQSSQQKSQCRGFTLIELLVVIAIIGLLSSVILFSADRARGNTRDKTRLVDIEQLHLALKLYQQGFDSFPTDSAFDDGVEIGVGGAIDTELKKLQANVAKDPKSNTTYQYIYDTKFDCTEPDQTVLYVKDFEDLPYANASTVCTDSNSEETGNEYIIILE